MSGAQSISTRRAYGVQRVCRVWHRARSSVYARRQATRSPALCRRRGPIGAAPDDVPRPRLRYVGATDQPSAAPGSVDRESGGAPARRAASVSGGHGRRGGLGARPPTQAVSLGDAAGPA